MTQVNVSLNLTKGERVDLTKSNPGLKIAAIGLGWDVNSAAGGNAYDLDGFALGLTGGKLADATGHICYFGSPKTDNKPSILAGAITHSGDNLTGTGDGDDETILVDFAKLAAGVDQIIICVNIYQAKDRGNQNFGQVNNAFVRVYDWETKAEIMKFDLSEDYSAFNGMVMGKLYLKDGEWKFQAVGEGKNGNINEIAAQYT